MNEEEWGWIWENAEYYLIIGIEKNKNKKNVGKTLFDIEITI